MGTGGQGSDPDSDKGDDVTPSQQERNDKLIPKYDPTPGAKSRKLDPYVFALTDARKFKRRGELLGFATKYPGAVAAYGLYQVA